MVISYSTCIGLGLGMVAGGTYLATYGWNLRSFTRTQQLLKDSREAEISSSKGRLISALVGELTLDIGIVRDRRFTEPNDAKLTEFIFLPRLQTTSLSGFISSGLFFKGNDVLVAAEVMAIHQVLEEVNRRLDLAQEQMACPPAKENTVRMRKALKAGSLLPDAENKITNLLRLLSRTYGLGDNVLKLIEPHSETAK